MIGFSFSFNIHRNRKTATKNLMLGDFESPPKGFRSLKQIMLHLAIILAVIFGDKFKNLGDLEEQIVGGTFQSIETIPYQAALYYRGYFFCAGSVVTATHIITAGHCLTFLPANPGSLTIRVGTNRLHVGGDLIRAKKFFIHPKFSRQYVDYDVAVIELMNPVKFSERVKAVNLTKAEPNEGEKVKVSGWGYISETGPPSVKLKATIVKTINRKECEKSYVKLLPITERMICAMADGKDACYGDSGGPLVYKDKLVGIVSSGEGCAQKKFAGIYTNIANPEVLEFALRQTGLDKNETKNQKRKKDKNLFHSSCLNFKLQ